MNVHALMILGSVSQGTAVREVRLEDDSWVSIGRDEKNGIVLDKPGISRNHARVRVSEGRVEIEDLGSRNGTFIVDADWREESLEPEARRRLELNESFKIGPFLILPCGMDGENLLISPHPLFDLPAPRAAETAAEQATHTSEPSHQYKLQQVLDRHYGGDPTGWILDGMLELCEGNRGFLFVTQGDRFVRKADRGVDGPVVVSERFLQATAELDQAWSIVTGSQPGTLVSDSLMDYAPDLRLVGVPIVGREGGPLALVYLECHGRVTPPLAELTTFARGAAPVMELHLALDREMRRREALQKQLGTESPVIDRKKDSPASQLIGKNPVFLRAVDTIRRAARTRATVIIRGSSGTGKDELARLLHHESPRKDQPYEVINAAALPETLIESELFGHERGAYTGAVGASPGAFERADGGTLFLDEIGDLSLTAQAKILRVIENEEVARLGGTPRRIDVRLVTATHRELAAMVQDGRFREDLYYRLKVIEVRLPDLAQRPEDVLPLAEHFLARYRRPDGESVGGISSRATRLLTAYAWPGNIRELRNVIERAVVLDRDGLIDVDDLSGLAAVPGGASIDPDSTTLGELVGLPWPDARKEFERRFFELALTRNRGRVAETAKEIAVTRRTVTAKIQEHQLRGREADKDST